MSKKFGKGLATKLMCVAMAIGVSFGCTAPVTARAADEFAGGNIVVDPEKQVEEGQRYMPGTYILHRDKLRNKVEKFSYDDNGRIIKVKVYDYSYSWDKAGNIIPDDYKINKYEYRYSYEDNKLVSRVVRKNGKTLSKSTYTYKEDKLTGDICHWKNDDYVSGGVGNKWHHEKTKYYYNKKGLLTAKKGYTLTKNTKTGKYYVAEEDREFALNSENYKYDRAGRIISYHAKLDGGQTIDEKYKFDKKGNYLYRQTKNNRTSWNGAKKDECSFVNKYDEKGSLYKTVMRGKYHDGSDWKSQDGEYSHSITYDENGYAVKEIDKYYENKKLESHYKKSYKNTYDVVS